MTRRPASAVGQVTALILSVIIVVEAISFALVLGMPKPESPRFTIRAAAMALASKGGKTPDALDLKLAPAPNGGMRAAIVEQALAVLLQKRADDVRASWIEAEGGRAPFTVVGASGRSPSDSALLLVSTLPLPAFSAAIRQPDGRWLVAEPDRSGLATWQIQVLAAFVLSAAVLVPVAIFAARRLTIPLRRLEDYALDDGSRQLARGGPTGPREVRAAFYAIIHMRDRLAGRARERVRILAAVAHDLRTPLTGLRLRIEDTAEPDRARMIEDADRMERMIEHMLAYARDDDPRSQLSRIDVPAELAQVAASFPADRVAIMPGGGPAADIWIDLQDFQRAIGNLVHNAISYGEMATIEARSDASGLTVMVHDEGAGIPADSQERVLLPFERGEGSRNRHTGGVGLGLSSARDIAWKYGGDVHFRNRPEGGFTVVIFFPARPKIEPHGLAGAEASS